MIIRKARHSETSAIQAVHLEAFGPEEGPLIAQLVANLLHDPTARPILSLVAENDERLLASVLFTAVTVIGQEVAPAFILCPLAVHSSAQGRGLGTKLVHRGLKALKERGAELVLVLGDPQYYGRMGFHTNHSLKPPVALAYPEAWQAISFTSGPLEGLVGTVQCAEVLNAPEHW